MRFFARLLARLSESVESELLASNALLEAQVKALQAQLGKPVRLTDAQKIELARLAQGLSPAAREQACLLAKPSTMMGWYRRLIARKFDGSAHRRQPGRPRIKPSTEELILHFAKENPRWGCLKICGALKQLDVKVSHQTILNVLRRNGYHPAERHAGADSWAWFLNIHRSIVVATDFFSVEVLTPRGLVTYFVLFFIELERRTVYLAGITAHPNEQWMMQVARNLTMADSGFLIGKAHVIMDRDAKYCPRFRAYLRREGIRVIRSPPMSPNMNAYAERWVRSVKHECLRFIIPVSRASLERALGEYVAHYNAERIHQGLDQEIPIPLSPRTRQSGPVQRTSRLGGLLNYYH
jgi:transposase InsO family protein